MELFHQVYSKKLSYTNDNHINVKRNNKIIKLNDEVNRFMVDNYYNLLFLDIKSSQTDLIGQNDNILYSRSTIFYQPKISEYILYSEINKFPTSYIQKYCICVFYIMKNFHV